MELEFVNVTYKENVRTPLEKTYINNFSYKFSEGKVYSIIGSTTSGKEKLPLLINAVNKPYTGIIKIGEFINDGKYIKNINKLRMNVGYIKENPNEFLFNKRVIDELNFGIKYFKYKLNKQSIRIQEALTLVGLTEDYLYKEVNSLSLNEKKRLSIASSLIFNPSIIVLEEPIMFLTYKDKEKLIKLIHILKTKYKKTIIIITKDTNLPYEVSDEVLLFSAGELVESGGKELLTQDKLISKIKCDIPEIVKFINVSNKMNANLTYTSNILDLIKEVYRNAK
jgi:energy-coupling factor transporter ATP-binding protein EcfA2